MEFGKNENKLDEDKQIDLFPVSKKEQNDLEKYVSSKQRLSTKQKRKRQKRKGKLNY